MRTLMAALVLTLMAACSGDDDSSGALADAGEVNDERAADAATVLDWGYAAERDGVSVTLIEQKGAEPFESGGADYADVTISVLFENRGDEDVTSPLITYNCSNHDHSGNQHTGPIDIFDPLPAGTKAEGEIVLGVQQPCEDGYYAWGEYRWGMAG